MRLADNRHAATVGQVLLLKHPVGPHAVSDLSTRPGRQLWTGRWRVNRRQRLSTWSIGRGKWLAALPQCSL